MTELTTVEGSRLQECEQVIERGLTVFVEVGKALTEIRDAKLYRASHKTFEAYCKDRWEIGRSRAYELIDQAMVVSAIADAGVNLSGAPDISGRDARAAKGDLPALVEDIKDRVGKGEAPEKAAADAVAAKRAAKDEAKRQREAEQAENDRHRDEARAALPDAIKQREAAKESAIAEKRKGSRDCSGEALDENDQIAELKEAVASLEAENARLKGENKLFGEMRVEWEKGGFAEVIAGKDEVIQSQARRIESESQEKVANLRRAEYWKREAVKLGWSSSEVIDLSAEARHG